MTPKMAKALADAFGGPQTSGLQYCQAGYVVNPLARDQVHSFRTIRALTNRGYLSFHSGRKWACITNEGLEALRAHRAKVRP